MKHNRKHKNVRYLQGDIGEDEDRRHFLLLGRQLRSHGLKGYNRNGEVAPSFPECRSRKEDPFGDGSIAPSELSLRVLLREIPSLCSGASVVGDCTEGSIESDSASPPSGIAVYFQEGEA